LLLLFVLFSALSLQSSVAAALHRLVKLFFFFLVVIVEPVTPLFLLFAGVEFIVPVPPGQCNKE